MIRRKMRKEFDKSGFEKAFIASYQKGITDPTALAKAEFIVKVMSCVPISPTAPLIGVRLLTRMSNVYNGLVADTAGTFCCTIFTATVVPNAVLSVANTFAAAVSFRKDTVSVADSNPLTNLCEESPMAVTSSSSAARFKVTEVTWSLRSIALIFRPTVLFKNFPSVN